MHAARAGGLCAALAAVVVALAAAPVHAQRVGVDPRTGRVVQPPAEQAAAPSADRSTSSEGLVEEAGATPGAGVTVHLGGRFRSDVRVTRTPDGRLVEDCPPGTAP
jgi:hypothetical protein